MSSITLQIVEHWIFIGPQELGGAYNHDLCIGPQELGGAQS